MDIFIACLVIVLVLISLFVLFVILRLFGLKVGLGVLILLQLSLIVPCLLFCYLLHKLYKTGWLKALGIWLINLVVVFLVIFFSAIVIRTFLFQPFIIDGPSMSETLINNDYILVNKYDRSFGRGDIIVFRAMDSLAYCDRIVAISGDSVEIKAGGLFVNGNFVNEPYITGITEGNTKMIVPSDQFFVLGDNREHSNDSRKFGTVAEENIIGKLLTNLGKIGRN